MKLLLVLGVAIGLAGCGSISEKFADTASRMPVIGLPAGAPQRSAEPVTYPAVHDVPPPHNSVTLTNMEQQTLEDDLVAAREQQRTAAGRAPTKKVPKTSQQPVVPVSSRASIY